jgi:hypothetical protein
MSRFFAAFILITVFALAGFAQGSNTGNLTGTIADSSGVIPGATVVLRDNQTGREKTVVSSSDGAFNFPQLEVGLYTVTVKSPGHKTRTYTDVKVDVGQTYTLTATLEAGDISEVVTVAGGADIVNSANGEISTTVTGRQIVELPLNGRNPLSLVLLQAGTSSNANNSTTINGQRSSFTNITRDGVNVQDNFIRTNAVDFLPDRPNIDDTGEFTIVTQNAGADLGYGASQVQLVTPRGTSSFHGALYEYNRNSKFSANTFFNNFNGVAKTYLNRNQFGGKIGGPLPLPRFGDGGGSAFERHKGFFFVAYEKFIQHQSTTPTRTILLPSARSGIFTFQDLGGTVRTVNIFTLAANAGLAGAPTGIDPTIASRILANLPTAGNSAAAGDQFNTTGLVLPISSNQSRDGFTSRYDVDANAKNSFNVVVNYKHEYLQRTDLNAQQGGAACCFAQTPLGFQDAHTPFVVGAWRWSPTSSLTNEFRAGFQKSNPIFGLNGTQPSFYLQVPLINNPEIGFDPQGRYTVIENFQDNAVWVRGNHLIKFGGSYDIYNANPFGPGAFGASYIPTEVLGGGGTPQFTQTSINAAMGCVTATGANCIASGNVGTANSLLALLGGMIGSANQTFSAQSQTGSLSAAPPNRNVNYKHIGPYVADQWKVTPTFTLNYGLRYELYTPVEEPNGLAIEAVFGSKNPTDALLDPNGTYNFVGTNLGGHRFFKADKNNFAPVVSFAWSPNFKSGFLRTLFPGDGKTVLRGGYRISYVNDNFVRAADNALSGNAGLTSTVSTGSINLRIPTMPTVSTPALVVPRTYVQNNALAGNFGTVFGIDPKLQAPSLHEVNVGIERELGFDTALEIRFVHNQSNNLVRGLDLNQVNIFSTGFITDFNRARSNLVNYGTGGINCVVDATHPACQPLQLLNRTPFGNLTSATAISNIQTGAVADMAINYINGNIGNAGGSTLAQRSAVLLPNPSTGVVDWLTNSARSRYNALQVELRRRFTQGFTFQANYTFQKSLTDAPGTGQTAFEPLIDNADAAQEYGIADSDTTHVFNLNTIYELPFGKGKPFFSGANGVVDRILGGWQVTSIIRWTSGTPFTVTDPRGTFNRAGRAGRQQAFTTLTKDQLKKAAGIFRTPCGVYFIDPQYINLDMTQCAAGLVRPRVAGTTAGVAALGYNPLSCTATACAQAAQTFPGQVFFNLAPGQKGNTGVNTLAGPMLFNWDASIIKNIPINERLRLQIRAEAFNVLNNANFGNANQASINSSTFGRLSSTFSQRIVQFVGRIEF